MDKPNNRTITISEETQIDLPAVRHCINIERRDWDRVKKMVGQINNSFDRWENSAWAAVSLFSAFLITGITEYATKGEFASYFFMASFFSFIIAIFLFLVSRAFSKTLKTSKENVLLEMGDIEKNIQTSQGEKYKKEFEILSAIYGTLGNNYDVTQKLNEGIKDNKLEVTVSNGIAGDPDPGNVKYLKIRYVYQGNEVEKSFKEGEAVSLP
jgi:hypothetical protein